MHFVLTFTIINIVCWLYNRSNKAYLFIKLYFDPLRMLIVYSILMEMQNNTNDHVCLYESRPNNRWQTRGGVVGQGNTSHV